ncbi:6-aminohexanoate hydrolase [Bacillus pseudomycoides]|uniref:6-aminohexanoate hydrolase n=1 Tax=Bacillus pseudomycoides TaxID=64104 RepID=UPI000BEF5A51|nr:6-aminohexanoate hydrolase [Bacillus pseudomycoides]PEL26246.1 6-aminohexanoate hydrolase [Bacillus pseudomycoides]
MIKLLDNWMLESVENFNFFVGFIALLWVGSAIVLFIIGKKFGQPDERTNGIYFKIISCMFITQMITNSIFSLVDRDIVYFRQIFVLCQAVVFFVGAIYSFSLYRKEFK